MFETQQNNLWPNSYLRLFSFLKLFSKFNFEARLETKKAKLQKKGLITAVWVLPVYFAYVETTCVIVDIYLDSDKNFSLNSEISQN